MAPLESNKATSDNATKAQSEPADSAGKWVVS